MWQVYGDAARAAALFAEYAWCREVLLKHVQNGGAIVRDYAIDRSTDYSSVALAG